MRSPLSAIIADEIHSSGPMTFRRFMELALYQPDHGFYGAERVQIGRHGDFMTNVSVGSLFGRLLARQFTEMHKVMGAPADFTIVEQGAHRGEFAADVLGSLPGATAAYRIIEPSPALAALQRDQLKPWDVQWHSTLDETPRFCGVHFSNELPDAFPVHRVKWNGGEWMEQHVDLQGDEFVFVDAAISTAALGEACAAIHQPLPTGYVTEVNLDARAWIGSVARRLERGFLLAVDYGYERLDYYAPERAFGTLSAYSSHRREPNPLSRPGEIDLTAHVEFTSLIEAGNAAGLRLAGFTDQHHFMVGLGAEYFADGAHAEDRRAFQTLMHPQFMGAAFKVVCFTKGIDLSPLSGFRYSRPIENKE